MTWLDALLGGIKTVLVGGVERPARAKLNFVSGATVVDNTVTEALDITIGGASPYGTTPANLGTASPGVSALYARGDHVHGHGAQAGGSLHAGASGSVAGFMSAADKTKLDGLDLAELEGMGDVVDVLAADLELTSGGDDRARLQAKLDATGHRLVLEAGATYYISSALVLPSGAQIIGQGATITTHTDWDDSGVDPDDRTVSMLRIRGAVTGTVNTTLAATYPRGSKTITVASATGIVAGMRLRLSGSYASVPPTGDSYSGDVVEIVEVAGSYVSGTSVPLTAPTVLHHASGSAVQSCTPVDGIDIRDLCITAGAKTVPSAIEQTNCIDVRLHRLVTSGFTRADVGTRGAHDVTVTDWLMLGGSNGGLRASASHRVHVYDAFWTGVDGRQHASGITRHVVMIDEMCTNVQLRGFSVRHAAGALRIWGSHDCGCDGFDWLDLDGTRIINDAPSAERVTGDPGSSIGIAFDGGAGPINANTAFGHGTYLRNGTVRDVTQSATATNYFHFALSWHDHYEAQLSGVSLIQTGNLDASVGGIILVDSSGPVTDVVIKGYGRALETRNTVHDLLLDNIRIDASANNANGQYAIVFGGTAPIAASMRIGTIEIGNFNSQMFHWTSDWVANPNRTYTSIATLILDGRRFETVAPFLSLAGATPGSIMRLDNASSRELNLEATGPHREQWILLDYPAASGWCLAARDAGWARHSSTAAVPGDHLYAHSDGSLRVSNTDLYPGTKFVALVASSGGFVQVRREASNDATITATGQIAGSNFVGASLGNGSSALALTGNDVGIYDGVNLVSTFSYTSSIATLAMNPGGASVISGTYLIVQGAVGAGYTDLRGGSVYLSSDAVVVRSAADAEQLRFVVGAPSTNPASLALGVTSTGALVGRDKSGLRRELTAPDDAGTGATSKRILRRFDRKTLTTATTTTLVEVLAADLPSGDYSARVEVTWGAYDTTTTKAASGRVGATVRRSSSTTTIVTAAASQEMHYSEESGIGLSNTHPAVEQSSGNLRLLVGLKDPNNVRFWAELVAHVVEH